MKFYPMQKKLNTSTWTLTQVQLHDGTKAIERVNLIHWVRVDFFHWTHPVVVFYRELVPQATTDEPHWGKPEKKERGHLFFMGLSRLSVVFGLCEKSFSLTNQVGELSLLP